MEIRATCTAGARSRPPAANAIHVPSGEIRGSITERAALTTRSRCSPVAVFTTATEFRRGKRSMARCCPSGNRSRGRPLQSLQSRRDAPPAEPTAIPSPTSSSHTLQSVTLSINADAMRSTGDTAQVTPIGTFANGTSQNVMATCKDWRSDNVSVLTINSGGLVTAQGSGAAVITTTCQVVVDHPPTETSPGSCQ